ncbi:unnamed protein product [Camellia sinensis]
MIENKIDELVTPCADVVPVIAIGGYPGISVPVGFDNNGVPFGIAFGGLTGSEPKLIEIAYGFVQATKKPLSRDNIVTKDKLNTTAGSYALLSSVVARDAGVVAMLKKAGTIVLGKASMTEWASFRSYELPNGWCARAGQVVNPYVKSADLCGSSTGSTVSVVANMVTLSLGTETAGSILCPSSFNSVVGIKPTVGLTSRGGVVLISPRQDTVGPICKTVSDAVYVLDAIVGFDSYDVVATRKASKYITHDGYVQFLKVDGLRGKRLGITSYPFFGFTNNSDISQAFKLHFNTLRQRGAILVDGLDIPNFAAIMNSVLNDQDIALLAEFRLSVNAYLKDLLTSLV